MKEQHYQIGLRVPKDTANDLFSDLERQGFEVLFQVEEAALPSGYDIALIISAILNATAFTANATTAILNWRKLRRQQPEAAMAMHYTKMCLFRHGQPAAYFWDMSDEEVRHAIDRLTNDNGEE